MRNDLSSLIERTRQEIAAMIDAIISQRNELSPSDYSYLTTNATAMLTGANIRLLHLTPDV